MERRELRQRAKLSLDRVVDGDRLAEACAAVHDAVRDGDYVRRRVLQRRDRLGRVVGRDNAQLQARRARVDDEHPLVGVCLHSEPETLTTCTGAGSTARYEA